MTQVSLSPAAYAQLRKAKATSESFSDVVLRLLAEAKSAQRDPSAFTKRRHGLVDSPTRLLAAIEEDRDAWA
jgi:predicted CopG family antitoxin